MCIVSNVGDNWSDRFKRDPEWQQYMPRVSPSQPLIGPTPIRPVDRGEFEALKRQLEQMHEELRRAKKRDEEEGNPGCEMADKVALLRHIAKQFGVNMKDVFPDD